MRDRGGGGVPPRTGTGDAIFRLGRLHRRGGIYTGADDRCHGSLLPLLPAGGALMLYLEDRATLGNNLIEAVPGHPMVAAALRQATAAIPRGDREMVWLSTRPGMLTREVARAAATAQGLGGMVSVLDRHLVHGLAAMHCFLANNSLDRHWGNATFARGRSMRQGLDKISESDGSVA